MAFIDPIELLQLQIVPGQALEAEELRRAKRKLLAEFELQGGITIAYRGQQIDKAAALAALEMLDDQAKQYWLIRIHTTPGLKRVLQEQDERALLSLAPGEKLGPPDFRKFLSGLLAPVFNEILSKQVKKNDWPLASRLLNRLDLVDEWDHGTAVKGLVSHLRLNLIRLKELPADTETLKNWEEKALYDNGLMTAFNRLPKQFQNLRNQYAEALQDIALALAEKLMLNKDAYRVISAGASLSVDVNVANRIQHNQLWIWNRVKREQETAGQSAGAGQQRQSTSSTHSAPADSKRSASWGIIIVLIVVVAIFRIASMNRSSPSIDNYYRYTPPKIEIPEIKIQEFRTDTGQFKSAIDSMIAEPTKRRSFSANYLSETRYDTIFFKDLIFYENLNEFTERESAGLGEEIIPETGQDLYKKVWKTGRSIYGPSEKTNPVLMRNRSNTPVILFFETISGGEILHSYYIPAYSKFSTNELPGTFFKVRAYAGNDIRAGAFKYKDISLPAFTSKAKRVSVVNDDLEGKNGVVTLFNFGLEDYQTHEIKPSIITFTAESTLKTGD